MCACMCDCILVPIWECLWGVLLWDEFVWSGIPEAVVCLPVCLCMCGCASVCMCGVCCSLVVTVCGCAMCKHASFGKCPFLDVLSP